MRQNPVLNESLSIGTFLLNSCLDKYPWPAAEAFSRVANNRTEMNRLLRER